jgi:DnaK suppressor protein
MKRKSQSRNRQRHLVLKQMLEDRRREIQGKLRSLRETLPAEVGDVKDAEEQSVADFVKEVDVVLMQMKSDTLRKIDDAIRRLEAGAYGRCAECGNDIVEARLKALPFAERCRGCQEQEETRGDRARAGELRGPWELAQTAR